MSVDQSSAARPIRVIVYGMGRVNQLAIRLMRERGIEVVGAINRAGPKVGQDAGILAGLGEPIGITVSDDVESVLDTPADLVLVVVYDDLERMMPIFRACMERGLNVISAGAHHSYLWHVTPALAVELDLLAQAQEVTITGTGNVLFATIVEAVGKPWSRYRPAGRVFEPKGKASLM